MILSQPAKKITLDSPGASGFCGQGSRFYPSLAYWASDRRFLGIPSPFYEAQIDVEIFVELYVSTYSFFNKLVSSSGNGYTCRGIQLS